MKRLYSFLTALLFISTPFIASATVITWDYAGGILQPLKSARSAVVKGASFTATSTTANVFPYASSTALSATTLCLSTDCRTAWPSGSGSGGPGTVSTSTTPTIGQLAYWTSTAYPSFLGTVATGTLSASSPLSFDNARYVIGGNATLSIADAAADGSTKGAAAFTAADFDAASGVISLDYTNGQKASGSVPGFLSSTDWTTFNGKQAALTFTAPLFNSSNTVRWYGLATTSQPSSSNLLVSNGSNGVYGVATSTLSATSPLTGSFVQIGSGGSLGCQTASGAQAGCLSSADWTTFNGKQAAISTSFPLSLSAGTLSWIGLSTSTALTSGQVAYATGVKTLASVATSTLAVGSTLSVASGAFGYQIGGSAVTFGINLGNANSWTAKQTFTAASTTNLSAATYFAAPTTTATSTAVGGFFVNLNTASTSLRNCTPTTCYSWYDTFDKPTIYASSTLAYDGSYGASGTTTYMVWNPSHMTQLTSIYCKTDTGTARYEVGTGSATSSVLCSSSGATSATTVNFSLRANVYEAVGTQSSNPNQITVTPTYRYLAD